jgi:hypothetical protein
MKLRDSISVRLFLFGIACIWPLATHSEELLNPSELNFRVVSAEVTKEPTLCISPEGSLGMSSATPGSKMIKVTLKGHLDRPGDLVLIDPAFAAIYEKPGQKRKGVVVANAMCVTEGVLISTSPTQVREYALSPGPVEINLLFAVPEEVVRFQVTYPALAVGTAAVETKAATVR